MLGDLDSFDDILLPTTTTTERRPGKFRPRALAKTANVASTTPKNSDATQLVPPSPQPSAQDSGFNLEMERTGHEPGLSNYFGVAGGFLDSPQQSQGSLGQAKVDLQSQNKEFMTSFNDFLGIVMSLGVSTLNSSVSQPEAIPAVSKLFSNQSVFSDNENALFEEYQELNNCGEEANHNIQPAPKRLNYNTYMDRPGTLRWSTSETKLFYEAMQEFGTDFAMIQQLFPDRRRHQVKLKFKIEEQRHPLQVHDALLHRSSGS